MIQIKLLLLVCQKIVKSRVKGLYPFNFGVTKNIFYDASKIAILPMGFCYPGSSKTGDLPPRKECAFAWREQVLALLPNVQLVLLIGSYAIDWHLGESKKNNLTETVKAWKHYGPNVIPLPHPSPRNNIWLKKNDWFERDVLPKMRQKITKAIVLCPCFPPSALSRRPQGILASNNIRIKQE